MTGYAQDSCKSCTTVIVGREASCDGSVLLGHNEDWGAFDQALKIVPREKNRPGDTVKISDGQEIPRVEETFSYLWPGASCNGMNEHQLVIADNTGSCRRELFDNERGISLEEFVKFALQRAKTAREAVEIMGDMIERHGYKSYDGTNGDIFSIADPREGWWMEVTVGGLWVARRVPENASLIVANRFQIGKIDLEDRNNFLASRNLIQYAVQKNWYDPTTGAFDFAEVYGSPDKVTAYNTRREWRGSCLLSGRDLASRRSSLVIPTKKLSFQDIMGVLRDHYEGTSYECPMMSPHQTQHRTICARHTDVSTVFQLRKWLPPGIGGIMWFCIGMPCTGVYLPFYLGCAEFPEPYTLNTRTYDAKSASWAFGSLQNLAEHRKKTSHAAIAIVSDHWKRCEKDTFAMQSIVEKNALELYERGNESLAGSFLTSYCNAIAIKAYTDAIRFADMLRTDIYLQEKGKETGNPLQYLIPVPLTRQATDYTCGVAVLQSIFAYFGKEWREDRLAKELQADPEYGTKYSNIVEFAKAQRFDVQVHFDMTLEFLKRLLDENKPVILAIQAWSDNPIDYKEDWDDGHYVVAIGYDERNIYFMDPSTLGNYTFIPVQEFLERWHDTDSDANSTKLIHFGIVVSQDSLPGYNPRAIIKME